MGLEEYIFDVAHFVISTTPDLIRGRRHETKVTDAVDFNGSDLLRQSGFALVSPIRLLREPSVRDDNPVGFVVYLASRE